MNNNAIDNIVAALHWLGHDAFRLDSAHGAIYFDPYNLKPGQPKAALIMLTHEHFDHLSFADITAIITPQTIICAPPDVAAQLSLPNVKPMAPASSFQPWPDVEVRTVPAYNTNKTFHPKSKNWLGFVLKIGEISLYHAGDTDFIPEMADIKADIAMLPVSGTYVMTALEAVRAAEMIQPALAIPMHYGAIVGSAEDAELFAKELAGKIPVKILAQE